MIKYESLMEIGAVSVSITPLHKNVQFIISEFTDWNENSYMNC